MEFERWKSGLTDCCSSNKPQNLENRDSALPDRTKPQVSPDEEHRDGT